MQRDSDDDIDAYLRSLPPAPEGWVSRAEEMPMLQQALTVLRERQDGTGDAAAMRAALLQVGLEPDARRVHALARLRDLSEG